MLSLKLLWRFSCMSMQKNVQCNWKTEAAPRYQQVHHTRTFPDTRHVEVESRVDHGCRILYRVQQAGRIRNLVRAGGCLFVEAGHL